MQYFTTINYTQGAKNHGVIMPDANKEHTINQLIGAAFGAAGQRCMALSTAIFVGKSQEWIPEIVEKARKLKVYSMCIKNYYTTCLYPQPLYYQLILVSCYTAMNCLLSLYKR